MRAQKPRVRHVRILRERRSICSLESPRTFSGLRTLGFLTGSVHVPAMRGGGVRVQ